MNTQVHARVPLPRPSAADIESPVTLALAVLGVAAGLFAAVAATAATPEPPSQEASLERALRMLDEGSPTRAVFHLKRHLADHPHDHDARVVLACTQLRLGLVQPALQDVHLVLSEAPDHAAALRALADVQLRTGDAAEALATLDRPGLADDDESRRLRARALVRAGRHAEAEDLLARLVATLPQDAALHALRGLNALRLPDEAAGATAVAALQQAVALAPQDASWRNTLGFALERSGQAAAAAVEYAEAEGLSGGDPRYAANRRRLEALLGSR